MSAPLRELASRARERLAGEEGFSLMELLVAVLVGGVVVTAAVNLLDAAGRASTATQDRVDAVQRGRTAMDQVVQRLRAQVCPLRTVAPILYGNQTRVTFYSDLSNRTDGAFQPEVRRLRLTGRSLIEDIWQYQTAPGTPTLPSYAATLQTEAPATAPTSSRTIATDVVQATNDSGTVPLFRYYKFDDGNPREAKTELSAPLTSVDRASVVKIGVAFDSRPSRGEGRTRKALDTRFESQVFVRPAQSLKSDRQLETCP